MDIRTAIDKVVRFQNLTELEMQAVMNQIMCGGATSSQMGSLLTGLRMKGETVDEIVGAVRVMRSLVTPVPIGINNLVDTCGTGGDGARTFNISTASAFVAAAAGARVAKHGNRSVSSVSGSADVLERAGVALSLSPEQVAHCVERIGVGFLFAPAHHSAMKFTKGPRQEMGIRTLFNLLGPLTNPAGACCQVIGVFDKIWLLPVAQVLQRLGSQHALVVHGQDGMDEISVSSETYVAEVTGSEIREYIIKPEDFGIERSARTDLEVASVVESLELMRRSLSVAEGAAYDIVALNAGAALYATDIASSIAAGVEMAQSTIASGLAIKKLDELVELSQYLERQSSQLG